VDQVARVSDVAVAEPFPLPDDPHDVADFVRALRALKLWAGDPSLEVLRRRTRVATSTLSDAFNPQRRRMPSLDLVRVIVRACGADPAQVAGWERAWRQLRERTDIAAATESAPLPHPVPRPEPSRNPSPAPRPSGGGLVSPNQDAWVPRELPPDVSGFVGRAAALDVLTGQSGQAPATVITGTAGVGKTALAVHWAHQIAEQYPDGQLYLDLRGHAGDPAITPTEALPLLLQSLGVPSERIPVDLHPLISLYRSVLAGLRVLVVLDNIVDAAHARPLLPSGPHCRALITSRDALTGLVAREGAARITLDTLTAPESAELLATHLGPDRVGAEPDATAELAQLCAHLPLALRISAANLAARPNQTISGTVRELRGSDRLGRLQVIGDSESAVAAAFDLSYRSLPEQAQHLFRRLGLVPGPEVDRQAAAILLDRDPDDPVLELEELLTAHLLFEPRPGRYRMHDLLALYARRHAADEPEPVREAALHRLLSWYQLNTDVATRIVVPPYSSDDRAELKLTGTARDFAGPDDARAWLEAELPNLAMAVTHTAEHGPAPFAWHLADGLRGYLMSRASGGQQIAIAQTALHAAEANDDAKGQALCHLSLAAAAVARGDLHTNAEQLETARQYSLRIQYARGIELACGNLGDNCFRLGDISRADSHFKELLAGQPALTPSKALNLSNLAMTNRVRGEHAEALRLDCEGLAYAEQTGSPQLIAGSKLGLAMTHLDLGDPTTAEPLLLEVNRTAVELGSDIDVYDVLAGLVLVCVRTGRTGKALTWMSSLGELIERGVYSCTGDDWAHAAILEAHLSAGLFDEAIAMGEPALQGYDRTGHRLTAMRVRIRLGRIHAAQGNTEAARRHWESALAYAIEQFLPDRAVIEKLLADPS
jgi:tetratricopeptide (TPR) repeat protein